MAKILGRVFRPGELVVPPVGLSEPFLSATGESGWLVVIDAAFRGSIASSRGVLVAMDGMLFDTPSPDPAAIVMERYLEVGTAALKTLDGEFSFAIWDERVGRLVLCRDSFGRRPLFFSMHSDGVTVASRVKLLGRILGVQPLLRFESLSCWFSDVPAAACDAETMYEGVYRAPPNHLEMMDLRRGDRTREKCWFLPTKVDPKRNAEDVRREFPDILSGAIRRRRFGRALLLLSGGMDSASIATLAKGTPGRPGVHTDLAALTTTDEESGHPDGPRAEAVARFLGLEWKSFDFGAVDPVSALRRLQEKCEFPIGSPGILLEQVCEIAVRDGYSDLVDGVGADIFWDHPRPESRWPEWTWRVRGQLGRMARESKKKGARSRLGPPATRLPEWGIPHHLNAADGDRCPACSNAIWSMDRRTWRMRAAMMEGEVQLYLFQNLASVIDEYRLRLTSPFLDREVSSYVFTTPPSLLRFGGRRKGLQRFCFAPMLPPGFADSWERSDWGGASQQSERAVLKGLGIGALEHQEDGGHMQTMNRATLPSVSLVGDVIQWFCSRNKGD